MSMTLFMDAPILKCSLIPRNYQNEECDESFKQWDSGTIGTMARAFTSAGKTFMACLKMDRWLARGEDNHCMVISYETQLVDQFAQEIVDYMGIIPGIEMDKLVVSADDLPRITVASRQSLLRAKPLTPQLKEELEKFGLKDLGVCHKRKAEYYLKFLKGGGDPDSIRSDLDELNSMPEAKDGFWSRVHKFDYNKNWLLIFDEAHRHVHSLASVGHIVDWFEQNPQSRRHGMTATPKRSDGISGKRLFPGISLDYPLFRIEGKCAVRDGWAVPYVQKYIAVEGVDFRNIKQIAGDFDDSELERILGEEGMLAKLIEPLLDLVGDRQTLIFSPGVDMAKNVARYINVRSRCKCTCGKQKWYPNLLIGDGAKCECGRMIDPADVNKTGEQAKELDGEIPHVLRKPVYDAHKKKEFMFLSVCALCREGYNDPDVSCVACFRLVSKKAASLAEQMKGRGCRVSREVAGKLHLCKDAEERCRVIAESDKPYCLIIDLVGISGLADCVSTVQIYAEGLPDEIVERAEEILEEAAIEEQMSVEEAVIQAKEENDKLREKIRQEREAAERRAKEEAERRAKADASVTYTMHDVGYGSAVEHGMGTEKQYNYAEFLGMKILIDLKTRGIGRIIDQLKKRTPLEEIAHTNGLREGDWEAVGPSFKQVSMMQRVGVKKISLAKNKADASVLIDAKKNIREFDSKIEAEIANCKSHDDLTCIGHKLRLVIAADINQCVRLVDLGRKKRASLPKL